MKSRWFCVVIALQLVTHGCDHKDAVSSKDRKAAPAWAWSQPPRIGIDVLADGSNVTFRFKICGATDGAPFVDRLVVEKLRPATDKGTVCKFESESDEGVLRGEWRYGEKRPGVGRCWPLTDGEYIVGAIGSGGGQTRFRLTKRWFGSGFSVRVLDPGCK